MPYITAGGKEEDIHCHRRKKIMLILTCVSLQISSKLMADEDVFIYLEEVSHSKKEIGLLDSTLNIMYL